MTRASELKPCPFCGLPPSDGMGYDWGKVGCGNARCMIGGIYVLTERWNTRAANPLEGELVESLDYLLQQTVDQDLKYGIALSEGEEDARRRALDVIGRARP